MSDSSNNNSDYESSTEETNGEPVNSLNQKIAVKIVRTALALNHAKTPITKANLQRHAWEDVSFTKVNFNAALAQANSILNDTFGLSIDEFSLKEQPTQGKKKEKKIQQPKYMLVNAIKDPYLKFLLESQWLPKSNALFQSELLEARHDYRNNKEQYSSLSTDQELVSSGLALAVVSIIMVSNNHVNEVELLTILKENFGVDPTKNLEILNMSIVDFLKHLDKTDYVNRSVIKADNEEIVEYSVGRRSKSEFTRESFIEFSKIIFGEPEGTPEFLAQVNATIDATYGSIQT